MTTQLEIRLPEYNRGFHLVTETIMNKLPELPNSGLLHLLIKHTSAGLTINENADSSVRYDFENFINSIIPENHSIYTHIYEGDDDIT